MNKDPKDCTRKQVERLVKKSATKYGINPRFVTPLQPQQMVEEFPDDWELTVLGIVGKG